jgi:cbb3-type cytochrome oxidase maturation protein
MTIIYVLIPLSLLLLAVAIGFFVWALRNGQYDDMDTPALDILRQEDSEANQPQEHERGD